MKTQKDIILQRGKKGRCSICDKVLPLDVITVNYKETNVKVCALHMRLDNNENK